jgi:coenzyme F420-0:L-glutamate ligase/coenzyme F420-1:gamma-L-glutamate ligase
MATVDRSGQPHLVPIVYTFEKGHIFTPLDNKPKSVQPRKLRRVRNIEANPHVVVLVDDYGEDWSTLAWVQVRGEAEILESGTKHSMGIRLLTQKYPQYLVSPIQDRPIISITPEKIVSWRSENKNDR